MIKYAAVVNRPNRIATIHLTDCSHIGPDPTAQTTSAERRGFEDGFDALRFAQREMPLNFGFCGHCLSGRSLCLYSSAARSMRAINACYDDSAFN